MPVRAFFWFSLSCLSLGCRDESIVVPQPSVVQESFGIPIVFDTETGMFPAEWLEPPDRATAKPPAPSELKRSRELMSLALKKYPAELLKANLDRVYVIGDLQFAGISASGTNSFDRVYVVIDEVNQGFSDEFVEGTFHHEFSSILMRNYPEWFPEKQWSAINPQDFRYGESGTEAVAEGRDSEEYNADLAKIGFISEYSQASLEEDFNSIATGLFTGNAEFWQTQKTNSPVRAKVSLAIKFYS